MTSNYKICDILPGHNSDIRCIDISCDGNLIVSVGRDKICNYWKLEGDKYLNLYSFTCGENYDMVVKIYENYNDKFVLLGGMDKILKIYDYHTASPLYQGIAHTSAISSIDIINNDILTGSWDNTIKRWNIYGNNLRTYNNHSGAVWCLSVLDNQFLSGSADSTIILWDNNGMVCKTYNGHEGPVRSISIIKSKDEFLSCSNDTTIRLWNILNAACLRVLKDHDHFIYSLCLIPDYYYSFVSCGEENSIKIWKDLKLCDKITVPGISNWCIKVLPNEDIVLASSYNHILIYTKDQKCHISPDTLNQFEDSLNQLNKKKLSGVDIDKLESVEIGITKPGTHSGQTKMFRKDNDIVIYEWNNDENKWNFIGNALRELNNEEENTTKITYGGVEYDYVIDVELPNGPKLKLPFNVSDDPLEVAQTFIQRNNIDPFYTNQIVEFIDQNKPKSNKKKNIFPKNDYIIFNKTNIEGLINRIKSERNDIKADDIEILRKLIQSTIDTKNIDISLNENTLMCSITEKVTMLDSNNNSLLPILDIVKQLILIEDFFCYYFIERKNIHKYNVVQYMKHFLDNDYDVKCQMIAIRTAVNCLAHKQYGQIFIDDISLLLDIITYPQIWTDDQLNLSFASLIFNFSIVLHTTKYGDNDVLSKLLNSCIWIIDAFKSINSECFTRLLASIGNIIYLPNYIISSTHQLSIQQILKNLPYNTLIIQNMTLDINNKLFNP